MKLAAAFALLRVRNNGTTKSGSAYVKSTVTVLIFGIKIFQISNMVFQD